MSLYNMKSSTDGFIITKFDDDLNVESSYEYHVMTNGADVCHCPAGQRPSCRHRQMFPLLETRVDSAWMLDFDTRAWVDPTGEAQGAETEPTFTNLSEATASSAPSPQGVQSLQVGHADMGSTPAELHTETITPPDSHPFRRRL